MGRSRGRPGTTFGFADPEFDENSAQFLPDGKWVAYVSDKSGISDFYVRAFPEANRERKISTNGGEAPRWRGDGNELFFVAPDGALTAVSIRSGEIVRHGLYDIDRNGRFLIASRTDNGQRDEEGEERTLVLVSDGRAKLASR